MKQIYRHALLTLLLGATCATAEATTGDIINEDFSGFTGITSSTTSMNGWTLKKCMSLDNNSFPKSLFFNEISDGKSTATTPVFANLSTTGNAVMTFRYADTSKNSSQFSVTINGEGTFPDGTKTWNKTGATGSATFKSKTLKLIGVNATTSVTFKLTSTNGGYFALDDVVISTADQVTLRDDAANDVETKVADVTVGRTIQGGVWNTLCLPFNAGKNTIAQATGNAVEDVSLRTFSGFSNNELTFAEKDTITAGTPFLIKVTKTSANPVFTLASLKGDATAQTVTYNGASMAGTLAPTDIGTTGLFLTAGGKLKRAANGSTTLKGLRAYFTVPAGTTQARLMLDDGATVIDMVEAVAADGRWYAPDGRRYNTQPTRQGIYIKDGKKIIIR